MHAVVIPNTDLPVPINRPTTVLTPRGHLGVAIGRVDDLIADLDPEDTGICIDWLKDSLRIARARQRELLDAATA